MNIFCTLDLDIVMLMHICCYLNCSGALCVDGEGGGGVCLFVLYLNVLL